MLRARYSSYGARNVSDLARLALERIMGKPPTPDMELLAKVQDMNLRLDTIERHVAFLLERERTIA